MTDNLPVGGDCPFGTSEPVKNQKQNYPRFDFFNYAGIIRPVKLYTTPRVYIRDVTLVPQINWEEGRAKSAVIEYSLELSEPSAAAAVEVIDREGKTVGMETGASGRITVDDPHLWMPGDAYLYDVKITAGEDVYIQPFGIRTVRVDGGRFLINERPFTLRATVSMRIPSPAAAASIR